MKYDIEIYMDEKQRKIYLHLSDTARRRIFSITEDNSLTFISKEDLGSLADVVSMPFLHSVFRAMHNHIIAKNLHEGSYTFTCDDPSSQEKTSDVAITLKNTNLQKVILQE